MINLFEQLLIVHVSVLSVAAAEAGDSSGLSSITPVREERRGRRGSFWRWWPSLQPPGVFQPPHCAGHTSSHGTPLLTYHSHQFRLMDFYGTDIALICKIHKPLKCVTQTFKIRLKWSETFLKINFSHLCLMLRCFRRICRAVGATHKQKQH